ncbi:MAG: hypothetical protein ACI9U2_000690 [Bradymonadia bacterium]|jgi:hypothetical protein
MEPPKRRMSPYDALMFCAFAILWIIPITYVGSASTDIPDLPRMMKHQYRVACLFTRDVRSWSTYHVEIQTNGSSDWVEMEIDGIFDMPVFGYRTKLHRLCGKAFRGRMARPRMKEITNYIKARRRLVRPDAAPLDAVRVSRVSHPIKVLAKEVGRFTRRPLTEYLAEKRHRYLFGEQRWDGKRPKNVTWRSKRRRSKRKSRAFPKLKRGPGNKLPIRKPPRGSDLRISPKNLQLNKPVKMIAPATEAAK